MLVVNSFRFTSVKVTKNNTKTPSSTKAKKYLLAFPELVKLEEENQVREETSEDKEKYIKEDVEKLLKELQEKSKRFVENPSYETFIEYKETIKAILELLQENLKVQEVVINKGKKTIALKIVKEINEKLVELLQEVLKEEMNKIKVRNLAEYIKGLIVEILV